MEGACHIVHAGDIGDAAIVPTLRAIAPVTAIRGNVDRGEWADAYPETATVELAGRRLHLIHDRGDLDRDPAAEGWDVVIAGHSHKPLVERRNGILHLNPGSAGRRRFRLPVTLGSLDLASDPPGAVIVPLLDP